MMSLFKQPKPRPFHLEARYSDQRKQRLKKVEQRARRELGLSATSSDSEAHEALRGQFLQATTHARRRHARRGTLSFYSIGLPLLLLVVAMVLLCIMLQVQ